MIMLILFNISIILTSTGSSILLSRLDHNGHDDHDDYDGHGDHDGEDDE